MRTPQHPHRSASPRPVREVATRMRSASLLAVLALASVSHAHGSAGDDPRVIEARARLAALPEGAVNARASIARWLESAGFAAEAERELERVLRTDPGQRTALDVLAARRPPADLAASAGVSDPDDVTAWLRAGARACAPGQNAARRESLVTQIVTRATTTAERDALARTLLAELDSPTTTRRLFAAHALRRLEANEARARDEASRKRDETSRKRDETSRASSQATSAQDGTARAAAPATGGAGDATHRAIPSVTPSATPSATPHVTRDTARNTTRDATRDAASDATHGANTRAGGRESQQVPTANDVRPLDVLGPLLARAVLDPVSDVRDAAAVALRDAADPRTCGALVRALADPRGNVRVHAIEALARGEDPRAIDPLVRYVLLATTPAPGASGGGGVGARGYVFSGLQTAYVQDFDVEIAQASSIADPIVNQVASGVVLDATVGGISTLSVSAESWAAARALTRLTGQRHGVDGAAWKRWWDENRVRYTAGFSPIRGGGPPS